MHASRMVVLWSKMSIRIIQSRQAVTAATHYGSEPVMRLDGICNHGEHAASSRRLSQQPAGQQQQPAGAGEMDRREMEHASPYCRARSSGGCGRRRGHGDDRSSQQVSFRPVAVGGEK